MNPGSKCGSLPKAWPKHVKMAVLHVIALAHMALVRARSIALSSPDARTRRAGDLQGALDEIALLEEELRIKDGRMAMIDPHRRPYYRPIERMAILELKAARGWSQAETARRFLVSDGFKIDLKQAKLNRYAVITRELLAKRLSFLQEAGLSKKLSAEKRTFLGRPPVWHLAPDFQRQLNELGARGDIIKNLYAAMGPAAATIAPQVRRVVSDQRLSDKAQPAIRGVVVAKGPTNEVNDERFVVLEDRAGKPHYVRLWASDALDATRVGGVLEVGRTAQRRWRIAREVVRVAEASGDGLYSIGRHRKWLEARHPKASEQQVDRHLRAFGLNVAKLAKRADSGVVRSLDNAFAVDRRKLEKFTAVDWCQERAYTHIPCFRLGNRWYHRVPELIRWLNGIRSGHLEFRRKPRNSAKKRR